MIFDTVKSTSLAYYDTSLKSTIQVDNSDCELCAELIQNIRSINFASRLLLFSVVSISTYTYNNNKTQIILPLRLQCVHLKLKNYNITITFRPRKYMFVAEAFSILPY